MKCDRVEPGLYASVTVTIARARGISLAVIPVEDHDSQESGDLQRQRLLRGRGAAAGA